MASSDIADYVQKENNSHRKTISCHNWNSDPMTCSKGRNSELTLNRSFEVELFCSPLRQVYIIRAVLLVPPLTLFTQLYHMPNIPATCTDTTKHLQ